MIGRRRLLVRRKRTSQHRLSTSAHAPLAVTAAILFLNATGCASSAVRESVTELTRSARRVASSETVAFAVVRADSALVPLARLAGNQWTFPRRADGSAAIVNVASPLFGSAASDAVPARWYHFAPPDGEFTLTATAAKRVDDHCESALALTINLPGQNLGRGSHHRLLGIAADAPGIIRSAVPVFETAPIWSETFAALTAAVDSGDAAWRQSPRNMLRLNATDSIAFKASFTLLADGVSPLYMVIADRDYLELKPGNAFQCPTTARYTAFARPDASGELKLFGGEYEVDACDRKGMGDITIIATANIGDRSIVFVNKHYYEWENYFIFEVAGNSVREIGRVAGGGC